MSLPSLDPCGLLPSGIHGVTLEEIEVAFGGSNPRRAELFGKLRQFVDLARGFKLFTSLFVDGSFTTDKQLPGDVDAVLELPRANLPALLGHPDVLTIWNPKAVKATYEVHLFIEPPPTPMVRYFQGLRTSEALARALAPAHQRGILKVTL